MGEQTSAVGVDATLCPAERGELLAIARRTLEHVVRYDGLLELNEAGLPRSFLLPRACFVTLMKDGELRGCIGHLTASLPLYRSVMENTRNAALRDLRFTPVTAKELDHITIGLSLLTMPEPLAHRSPEDLLDQLHPREHGVILAQGGRSATFLPQVWEHVPDKIEFLERLSSKAGLPPSAWRDPETTFKVYRAECFGEDAE